MTWGEMARGRNDLGRISRGRNGKLKGGNHLHSVHHFDIEIKAKRQKQN